MYTSEKIMGLLAKGTGYYLEKDFSGNWDVEHFHGFADLHRAFVSCIGRDGVLTVNFGYEGRDGIFTLEELEEAVEQSSYLAEVRKVDFISAKKVLG